MSVGILTRLVRLRAGLTLRELADRAGTSDSTLSNYESGRKDPRASTLLRILAASGTELQPVPLRSSAQRFVDLMCLRLAEQVAADPGLLEAARAVLPRLRARSSWVSVWERLLDAGPEAVIAVLTSFSPEVTALKTDSPLALLDLIDPAERQMLLEAAYAA